MAGVVVAQRALVNAAARAQCEERLLPFLPMMPYWLCVLEIRWTLEDGEKIKRPGSSGQGTVRWQKKMLECVS